MPFPSLSSLSSLPSRSNAVQLLVKQGTSGQSSGLGRCSRQLATTTAAERFRSALHISSTNNRSTTGSLKANTQRFMMSTTGTAADPEKPVALFLNASRLDYDRKLDFTKLAEIVDFRRNDQDYVTDPVQLVDMVQEHQPSIVITKEMQVPADCVKQFPDSVQLLCEAGTGYNNIPTTVARDCGITVCNIPTYSTEAVAHMAITYLMNLSISMFEQQAMLQRGDRSNFTGPFTLPLSELNQKTLGLVGGAGRIGSKVADVALALGMKIIISSRAGQLPDDHRLKDHPDVACVANVDDDLLPHCDYVSLHTPLNDQTRGTFGRKQLEQMRPTAFLINTSRGAVCNEEELIACLKEKVIAGAGLDVTTTEPAPMESELWDLPNVWLSPHIGWRRIETRQRLVDMTYDNILAFNNAKSPEDYVNVVN